MKKFVAGFIAGAIVFTAGTAFAANGLTGKKVGGEVRVTLNGKTVDNGAVIEGTSLLPVRSISEALGLDVSYSKGVVALTSEVETSAETSDPYSFYNTETKINERITRLEENITSNEKFIADQQYAIDVRTNYLNENPNSPDKDSINSEIEGRKKQIETYQQYINNNKNEITALKAKLATLQTK
ncbi:hypothetical protein SAMN04487969_101135 [Paenibacillus algorifonticola]|uniref:Copper amine oxidase N-terminal domain-containing protein n=1 Tax=Paenibacillus algorifonticola TaxID=684063 RepID=A0A1I1XXU0_9BACL|nr:hypothetical protein [Paenibacillus algorifonticola]SFE11578.1 hypothetical protein SAMN04487969_101135 [Paenibacillus algorifonticola]